MNTLLHNSAFRIGLFAAVLVSWFAFSNRCALGRLLSDSGAETVQHECCNKKEPGPEKVPAGSDSPECCKELHALATSSGKTMAVDVVMLTILPAFVLDLPSQGISVVVRSNTGPPEAESFSELVLHRSLQAHAPPICA